MVIPELKLTKRIVKLFLAVYLPLIQLSLKSPKEPFYPSILPGAAFLYKLMADSHKP